jgi:hypothetical protein
MILSLRMDVPAAGGDDILRARKHQDVILAMAGYSILMHRNTIYFTSD